MDSNADRTHAVVVACVAATVAFWAYTQTLLRGVDLGDTGGFQAAIIEQAISAREAYPLYLGLARPFVRAAGGGNPALALNLFSAIAGAVAIFLLTYISARVARSAIGGLAAGLLFAFSYTWWNQAIIAEVYTLHLALVGVCLVALYRYGERPSIGRMAVFFAIYALSFGNHLSMILLLIPFAGFLALTGGPRELVRPRVLAVAAGIAIAGALQYVPQLIALRNAVGAPEGAAGTLRAFWFDVTKSDWRESMLMGIAPGQLQDHLSMAWFDVRQQFGLAGLLLAAVGLARLWVTRRPWAVLALVALVINVAFATTYNVGDAHVFFLPGHYFTAFLVAGAAMPLTTTSGLRRYVAPIVGAAATIYAVARGYDTWPAADRHADRRAEQLIDQLTFGLDESSTVLAADLDWQLENALSYAGMVDHREVAWTRLSDVMLHFPFFVDDNHAAGRDIVLTASAAREVTSAFGSAYLVVPDVTLPVMTLRAALDRIPAGSPYVLALLAPPQEYAGDPDEIGSAIDTLTRHAAPSRQGGAYEVMAGLSGQPPALHRSSPRPFRQQVALRSLMLDIRMESWLPTETFRRGGFGHIIARHQHVMALERGINLVWFAADGRPSAPVYAAGIYAPQPRFRIPVNASRMARAR